LRGSHLDVLVAEISGNEHGKLLQGEVVMCWL